MNMPMLISAKGRQRPVRGGKVDIAKHGKHKRVHAGQRHGQRKHKHHGKVFARHYLCGRNGKQIQKLVCLLPLFFGNAAHGQHRHQRHKPNAKAAQRIFKIRHSAVDVVQHGANANKLQQSRVNHIGRHAMEIQRKLMLQHGFHPAAPPFPVCWPAAAPRAGRFPSAQ